MKALLDLLDAARERAFAPISGYRVGAVVLGASGRTYLGANIEIPGLPLGQTLHAEQAAAANAYMAREDGVKAIAVTAPPCGHCRQFLHECSPEMEIWMPGADSVPLSELLPRPFGFRELGREQGAFPVQAMGIMGGASSALEAAAVKAASQAYAPYTGSLSGVAMETADGRIAVGSYIENAAFNPSLSPLHVALAGWDGAAIVRAVLAERRAAKIRQESFVRAALAALAPEAELTVIRW